MTTVEGVSYDYEDQQTYQVTVAAEDPSHVVTTIVGTVNLTDVPEPTLVTA